MARRRRIGSVLTEDTVFEDTSPAPDGGRIEGSAARGRILAQDGSPAIPTYGSRPKR